jgi:anaerobic magnesium-protoporphyrin IX monomethyl ester cyclase
MTTGLEENLGTRRVAKLRPPDFPDADAIALRGELTEARPEECVDIMLVNPPAPDGGIWIRTQHRVGRRSRENMVWPQVSLAQMAALFHPYYTISIVDAIAERMSWEEFEELLRKKKPRYYLTQVTAPTLQNDMYGTFLAKEVGARTIAFGTHVTPMPRQMLRRYPSLDFVLRGEPELTLVELIETLESNRLRFHPDQAGCGQPGEAGMQWQKIFVDADPDWEPAWAIRSESDGQMPDALRRALPTIKGLVWRNLDEIVVNPDRPFIQDLNDLPIPMHHLLPLQKYRMPWIKGPFTFIVTSRGCTAGCVYCIKHVSYQYNVRLRSPENIVKELWVLKELGINNIHMYADLFTVNREQVVTLAKLIIEQGLDIKWMCNSRVDYVDEEMLQLMAQSGCWFISWGIESANEQILKRARKGYRVEQVPQALGWAKKAGIHNWGYFIIGLPGETEETIQQTIAHAKRLPLDLALFHIAAPYPGTPFFFDVVENNWFRPGTRWEEVDMDRSTVLQYPGLPAERLEYWAKRAFREWAFRPGPFVTYLKILFSDLTTFRTAIDVGLQHLGWATNK